MVKKKKIGLLPVNLAKEAEPRSSNGLLLRYMLILANQNGNPLSILAWKIPWMEEPGRV